MPLTNNSIGRQAGREHFRRLADLRPNRSVPGEGPRPAQIMLIGERPGEKEAKDARPFVGLAGSYLDIYLANANLVRRDIFITNICQTFDEYEKPTEFELKRDWPGLVEEIITVNPTVIGAMGTYAVEFLLGRDRAQLDRTHGVPVKALVGGFHECMVVPMFHPAAGMYNPDSMPHCMMDFVAVAMTAEGKLGERNDIWAGREKYGGKRPELEPVRLDCGIDTEGSRRSPWCQTVSTGHGWAWINMPGERLVVDSRVVYLHNSLHDLSILRTLGTSIGDRQFRDTMVLAYLLGTEPQGLKDLAYRHCGMTMDSYQDIIEEADRNKALEYLVGADANEWKPAQEYVVVESGKARIRKPNSINQRVRRILNDVSADKRDKNGDPVDPRARWEQIEDYLKQDVVEALGEMPEATLDDVPRAKAVHYACRDSDATLRLGPKLEAKIDEMGLAGVADIDHGIIPMIDRMQAVGMGLAGDKFWEGLEAECEQQMGRQVHGIREATGFEINPDSQPQCAELLYKHLGLPIVKYTDTGAASTKDKALEAIVHLHPVVDMVLEYREASKIKSSYVNTFRRILRQGKSRVHPNMRITRVVTGRLACTKPNLLAIPVRSQLGKKVRGGFEAGDGRVIADYDLDQVEMRWMADESRDESLCKIFIDGKIDVHTDTASQMFGKSHNLVAPEERYGAKRVGFGVITGITEHGLLDQMILARAKRADGQAWTLDDCKQMIDAFFAVRPGVKRYMDQAGDEAERDGWVRDRWGRIRYLPGVWSPIKSVRLEARRQASSFKIQAGAQGLIKRAMAEIWREVIMPLSGDLGYGWDDMWPVDPLLQIHDSLMFEMAEDYATWVGPTIIGYMTQTTKSLTGLPFKAKGGTGRTWLEVKD